MLVEDDGQAAMDKLHYWKILEWNRMKCLYCHCANVKCYSYKEIRGTTFNV